MFFTVLIRQVREFFSDLLEEVCLLNLLHAQRTSFLLLGSLLLGNMSQPLPACKNSNEKPLV